jgi:hypothetical protein
MLPVTGTEVAEGDAALGSDVSGVAAPAVGDVPPAGEEETS